jgi:tRNA (guanine37-N1)-methyltransferase
MVLKPDPIFRALDAIAAERGAPLTVDHDVAAGAALHAGRGAAAERLAHIVLLCGRYEGFDERVRERVTEELSIGDYVLTGGELPALVVLDAVARFVPGVVGDEQSVAQDTFSRGSAEPSAVHAAAGDRGSRGSRSAQGARGTDVGQSRGDPAMAEARGAEPDPGATAGPSGRREFGRRGSAVAARA